MKNNEAFSITNPVDLRVNDSKYVPVDLNKPDNPMINKPICSFPDESKMSIVGLTDVIGNTDREISPEPLMSSVDEFIIHETINPLQCDLPTQTADEFHKDFFSFRDKVYWDSSNYEDPVDRMVEMNLDGNFGGAGQPNMRIKDIYDEVTKGTDLYKKQGDRLYHYDNIMPDKWNVSPGVPPTYIVPDIWK